MLASARKAMVVPVPFVLPIAFTLSFGFPILNSCSQILPSRWMVATTSVESALTTDTPTPWRPPDTLYPPSPNFPPAWSWVMTTVRALIFFFG